MNAFKHLLSTVGLVMGFACTAHAAPVAFGGSQYDVILAEGITWTAADAAASAMGSSWRLATITSAAEDSFVASLLSTAFAQRSHFWLGERTPRSRAPGHGGPARRSRMCTGRLESPTTRAMKIFWPTT